jgi:hypothetical protein
MRHEFRKLEYFIILGKYGGSSKLLFVHPLNEPSTKFDGSFISFNIN